MGANSSHNAQEQTSNVQQKSAITTSSTKQQKRKRIIDSENLEQPQTSIDIPSTFASKENFTPQEMACTTQHFVEKSTQEKNLEVQPIIFKWFQNLASGQKVEICGSWDNWSQKIPLNEKPEADGFVFTALHLKPGTYEFKYIIDGNWLVDPRGKLTENSQGIQNNLVVVEENCLEATSDAENCAPEIARIEVEAEIFELEKERSEVEFQLKTEEPPVIASSETPVEDSIIVQEISDPEVHSEKPVDCENQANVSEPQPAEVELENSDEWTDSQTGKNTGTPLDDSGVLEDADMSHNVSPPVEISSENEQELTEEDIEKLPVVHFRVPEKDSQKVDTSEDAYETCHEIDVEDPGTALDTKSQETDLAPAAEIMSSSEKKAPTTESGVDASESREEKSEPAFEAQKFEKAQEAEEEEKVLSEVETVIKKEEIDETEAVTEQKEQEREEEEYPLVVDTTPITEEENEEVQKDLTPSPPKPVMDPSQFDLEFLKRMFIEANGELLFDQIKDKYQELTGQALMMTKLNAILDTNMRNPAGAFTQYRPKVFKTNFSFTSRLIIKYQPE